jgi:RNA polymerase sigma-70 factor (ECF subfamily)
MGFFQEVERGTSFAPFTAFREQFGFVPGLFRCQTLLPKLIEAEAGLAGPILFQERALSRIQKERLLLTVAVATRDADCATSHYQMLCLLGEPEERLDQLLSDYRQAGLPVREVALMEFATKLRTNGPSLSREDVAEVTAHRWTDEAVLETVLITAWASFLASLSTGLDAAPDFEPLPLPIAPPFSAQPSRSNQPGDGAGTYLKAPVPPADNFPPFEFLRDHFGFIAAVFHAQSLRPEVIEAEVEAIRLLLLAEGHLTRLQKERILLVVSAANRNTYFVAVHSEVVRTLGIHPDDADRIAVNHRRADLAEADAALLDFGLKLAAEPSEFGPHDLETLRRYGFSDEQILEAVVMASFTNFLNTLQFGLGVEADFAPRRVFEPVPSKVTNLLAPDARPTEGSFASDPDAEAVARVQNGDVDAFEDLINSHSRRVYRTLVGILGNPEEACDAMQDTFLKAFQHLNKFQGRSKFSTWLVSIASNTGLQLLRERKRVQSLDDDGVETDDGFRPQQIRAWSDNPEQLCSKLEMRTLVEDNVMKLPAKYRVVLMLRDIEQLSIEEAAAALGLGISALKSRHLRGRMMLREALTPHFAGTAKGGTA